MQGDSTWIFLWISRTEELGQIFKATRLTYRQRLRDKASRDCITLNTQLVYVAISNYHMAQLLHQLFSSLQWVKVYRGNYATELTVIRKVEENSIF